MIKNSLLIWRGKHYSLRFHARGVMVGSVLVMLILSFMLVHINSGRLSFSFAEIVQSLTGYGEEATDRIIWRLRLPRMMTATFVGISLGLAGAVFQAVSRNPLSSPDLIGFTSGAATGAIIQIVVFNAGAWNTAIAALLSGLATSLVIFIAAQTALKAHGINNIYAFVLIGIGIGTFLSGVNATLLVMGDLDQAATAQLWLMGSLGSRTQSHALIITIGVLLALPVILWLRSSLALIELGEEMARQLGCSVIRTRFIAIITAVWLASLATAVAGPIAFIALAAPQLARRVFHTAIIPLWGSALMGAVLLLAADLVGLHFPYSIKLPIGMITSLVGGLYLLWLLYQDKRT